MLRGLVLALLTVAVACEQKSSGGPDYSAPAPSMPSPSPPPPPSPSPPPPPPPPQPVKVIDEQQQIPDGGSLTWRISSGTYSIRVVSSPDGAKVKWVGASCANSGDTKEFNSDCIVRQDAQLVVENPTTLGLGPTNTVLVVLTRQP